MKNFKKFIPFFGFMLIMVIVFLVEPHIGAISMAFALPIALNPLLWPSGTDNPGGFKQRVLFVPDSAVTGVPAIPSIISAIEDYVTAAGAFVFGTAGVKPKFIYCTKDTVKYSADNQGEDDSQSFKQKGEFFFPGNLKAAAAFARYVNNTPGYLVLEAQTGEQILVGQKGMLCNIKPSCDLGQKTTDRRGYKFTFECDSFVPTIFLGTPIDMEVLAEGTTQTTTP